ncbi:MAG: SDR family NAD(P)-dependent oxidoreductase, partial [Cyanobacteria bacterium J06607_17]
SLRLEHSTWQCTCVDLPVTETSDAVALVLDDLRTPDDEDQIAYRDDKRFVARLLPTSSSDIPPRLTCPDTESFRLGLTEFGVLDHLTLLPDERRSPAAGEVEIQVKASGVNFRDVLNALGMLTPVLEEMGFKTPDSVPFGGECAGVVTAVGDGVNHMTVGDAVIAAQAIGSLSQFVTVKADFVVPKPPSMSFAEAATLPTTFLTAYYGLVHLAQMQQKAQPRQRPIRILIHAAAGGVGQAAVQIAQSLGADIFATASPGKWSVLRAMGIQQVMNSRTLDFADEVLAATQGEGVDVVFNSLNGEAIAKSLDVLAPDGIFVEIGKIGIWDSAQMQQRRPDVTYVPFDLLEVSNANPSVISTLLTELMAQFHRGTLKPLPKTVFPIESAPEAFRFMAQARHVGKVVLTLPPVSPQTPTIRPNGAYLITGGLGALGLCLAQGLADQGAQHLVLIGRRSPSASAQSTIHQLEQTGVTVTVLQADVAHQADLRRVLRTLAEANPDVLLKGVFHLAGILDDGLLANQSWEQLATVMNPKLMGAWNLHAETQHLDLDYFVCFSSIASLMGSLGQSNYAAANAFLDGLAHHRRSLGLPALSINWGPWDEVGMAAQLDSSSRHRFAAQGLTPIPPQAGKP